MNDWENPKHTEINLRHSNKLDELRERQQQRLREINEKTDFQVQVIRKKIAVEESNKKTDYDRRLELKKLELNHRRTENERSLEYRNEELEEKRAYDGAQAIARANSSLELEHLRHELREAERGPDFEDHKMRTELDYLVRRQEGLDGNKLENYALERKITELRALSRADVHKLVLVSVLEHIQGEHIHRRTALEVQAHTENEMLKAEQAHGHQIEQDNNASRLRVSEMFSAKFLDLVFSQLGGQVSGLSRTDVDAMVSEWEKEGDRLKK